MSAASLLSADWLTALRDFVVATATCDLLWETAQLPLYTIGQTGSWAEKGFTVFHCTLGDVLIAVAALTASLIIAGEPAWPGRGFVHVALLTLAIGLGYTVWSEFRNVEVLLTWAYSEWMPRLPPLGTGLSPVLQWIIVPTAAFAWAHRRRAGASSGISLLVCKSSRRRTPRPPP